VVFGLASFQVFFAGEPPFRGAVVAFDKSTGEPRWRVPVTVDGGTGVSVWSSPAADTGRGLVFIGTGQQYAPPDTPYSDALVAIDYKAGTIKWARQFTAGDSWTLNGGGGNDYDVGASPNLFEVNGKAMVGVGDKAGNYYGVNRDTGVIEWTAPLNPGGKTGGVMATAAYHDGVIYVLGNDGASGGGGFGTAGPPRGTLYALDAATGTPKWEKDTAGAFGAITYANGVVYFPTLESTALSQPSRINAVRASDGEPIWTQTPGEPLAGGFSVSDGMLYVGNGWVWLAQGPVLGGVVAYGL
jgi:polyvinyl alcohol dehydrogenase (cytochrome)